MISSVFSKSKPINFVLVLVILGIFLMGYNIQAHQETLSFAVLMKFIGILGIMSLTIFAIDFITKRNALTKQNSYMILLFLFFAALFPAIFRDWQIVLSNLFIILAIRRIVSLRSLTDVKQKLFDATFWVVVASLFYFWSILFLLLIFIGILLYVSEDYKNWVVPPVTILLVSFLVFAILFITDNLGLLEGILENRKNFDFEPYIANLSLSIPIVFLFLMFLTSLLVNLRKQKSKTYQIQNSIFLILVSLAIAVMIVLVAPSKNGGEMVFCIFPLAVIITNYIEGIKKYLLKEAILLLLIILPIIVLLV